MTPTHPKTQEGKKEWICPNCLGRNGCMCALAPHSPLKERKCKHKWKVIVLERPSGMFGTQAYTVAICEKCLLKTYV